MKLYRVKLKPLIVRADGNIQAVREGEKLIKQGKVELWECKRAYDMEVMSGYKADNERK